MYSSLGSHLKPNFVELLGLEYQWALQTCYCSTALGFLLEHLKCLYPLEMYLEYLEYMS